MPSLNKVMLIGRLGKDPEIKKVGDGEVCNFSVATSESWKDKRSGERKERTEWHTIVVWNENAINFADKYLKKGDLVYIEGQIQTRKWEDQDTGKDRYATEVVVPAFGGRVDSYQPREDDDRDDRGGRNSRSRDDDDRGGRSSRSRDKDDDRGSRSNSRSRDKDDDRDDRGGRSRGRDRDDDRGSRDDKGSRGNGRRSAQQDLDDEVPF